MARTAADVPDDTSPPLDPEDGLGEVEDADEGSEATQTEGDEDAEGEGGADDAGGDGDEEGDEPAPRGDVGRAARPQGRAEGRVQRALRDARDARAEVDRMRAELAAERVAAQQRISNDPAQRQREYQEEQERLRLMSPEQMGQYFADKTRREVGQALGQQQMQIQDTLDRQAFSTLRRDNALIDSVADETERTLASERNQGRNPSREVIATYLIGQRVRAKQKAARSGQQRGAARRVAGQTTRPGTARSDAARPNGRAAGDSIEATIERLKGQAIF